MVITRTLNKQEEAATHMVMTRKALGICSAKILPIFRYVCGMGASTSKRYLRACDQ